MRTGRLRTLLFCGALFVLAFVLTVIGLGFVKHKKPADSVTHKFGSAKDIPGLSIGETVDLPILRSIDGSQVDLSQLKNHILFVGFISESCQACISDLEFWKASKQEASEKGADFFLISIDNPLETQNFVEAHGLRDFQVVFGSETQVLTLFKVGIVPQYLLLTSQGKVVGRWNGIRGYDSSKPESKRILSEVFDLVKSNR
jgi:peroxiredoxin